MTANDEADAKSIVEEFMNGFERRVWDWWEFGGRWHGLLYSKEEWKGCDYLSDVRPLADCIMQVYEYPRDILELARDYWEKLRYETTKDNFKWALKGAKTEKEVNWGMARYYAKVFAEVAYLDFSTEVDVYDMENYEAIDKTSELFSVLPPWEPRDLREAFEAEFDGKISKPPARLENKWAVVVDFHF